jgi:hypothetical protein
MHFKMSSSVETKIASGIVRLYGGGGGGGGGGSGVLFFVL